MAAAEPTKPQLRKTRGHHHALQDEPDDPRERGEGTVTDSRHAILEPHADKARPMTPKLAQRLELVIRRADLPDWIERVACAVLARLDHPTLIYYPGRKFLYREAKVSKRIGQKAIEWLARRGVILRSNAPTAAKAGDLRYLHYDAHDARLLQPTKWREPTTEWREGIRLIEWVLLDETWLATALSGAVGGGGAPEPPHDRIDHPPHVQNDHAPHDRIDHAPHDPGDHPFHQYRSLHPLALVSEPDLDPHFSALVSHRGTLGEPETAAPERIGGASGAETRVVAYHAEPELDGEPLDDVPAAPPSGTSTHEARDESWKGAGGSPFEAPADPWDAREPEPSSPEGPDARLTRTAEWAELGAIVALAAAASRGLGRELSRGALLGRLANLRREGLPLAELRDVVDGVPYCDEPEGDTARASATPFRYAFSTVELIRIFAHAGRLWRGSRPASRAPVASTATASGAGGGPRSPADLLATVGGLPAPRRVDPDAIRACMQEMIDAKERGDDAEVARLKARIAQLRGDS